MATQSKRDEMAEQFFALNIIPVMQISASPEQEKEQYLKTYKAGFNAAIEEVLQTMNEMLLPTSPTMFELRTKIKSLKEK